MSASAAVPHVFAKPPEESALQWVAPRSNVGLRCSLQSRSEQIRKVVRRAGWTMARISAATSASYGKNSPFFVPPTFLYKQKEGVSPHVCQLVALSQVTGYRFRDWMEICGFDLGLALALQIELPVERTVLVTPDPGLLAFGPWLSSADHTCRDAKRRYLFAKIGSSDAVVYPTISPGSLVRADRGYSPEMVPEGSMNSALWLVEHPGGLACCRIRKVDGGHIVLLPNRPPLPEWPLCLAREARVLGLVDLELRSRSAPKQTVAPPARFEHRPMCGGRTISFSSLVRASRLRAGLTLRAAHNLTMTVARLLGDRDYGIAFGQLSDYEAANKLPRHIAKLLSLSVVYGIHLLDLLAAAGIQVDDTGKAPLCLQDRIGHGSDTYVNDRHLDSRFDFTREWRHWNTDVGAFGTGQVRANAARAGT